MRENLRKFLGKRITVVGTFVRYGYKRGGDGGTIRTILFADIVDPDDGSIYSDHGWFNLTADFAELGELQPGDTVQFSARVKRYVKGYRGQRRIERLDNPPATDYRLSHPTEVVKLEPTAD